MLVNCDSDAVVFILNCTFTTVFCLRRECRDLKSSVLLVLALSDWLSVLCRTFTSLSMEKNLWLATACVCEQPRILLQTGVFILNLAILTINTDLTDESLNFTKRQSYLHLVLFNAASFTLTRAVTNAIARALDDAGDTVATEYVMGVTFLVSIYRTVFLSLDCLYYACTNPENSKGYLLIDNLTRGDKAIIIHM